MADVVVVAPLVRFESDEWKECLLLQTDNNPRMMTTTTMNNVPEENEETMFDNLNEATPEKKKMMRMVDRRAAAAAAAGRRGLNYWIQNEPNNKMNNRCFSVTNNDEPTAKRCHQDMITTTTTTTTSEDDDDDKKTSANRIWNHEDAKNFENETQRKEKRRLSIPDDVSQVKQVQQVLESDDEDISEPSMSEFNSSSDEPVKSADEIINEIVEMMEDDLDTDTISLSSKSLSRRSHALKMKMAGSTYDSLGSYLSGLPTGNLMTLREELDGAIREYSEVLLNDLVSREDLVFQKELFNQFISLLLSIQKKRRIVEGEKKKGRPLDDLTFRYLTTVIPYDDHQRVPDVEILQIYIKILSAIDEDNSRVPALLTDYILNVLCPKTT